MVNKVDKKKFFTILYRQSIATRRRCMFIMSVSIVRLWHAPAQDEQPRCNVKQMGEGKIGKIRIHRSGRVTIALADNVLDVSVVDPHILIAQLNQRVECHAVPHATATLARTLIAACSPAQLQNGVDSTSDSILLQLILHTRTLTTQAYPQ